MTMKRCSTKLSAVVFNIDNHLSQHSRRSVVVLDVQPPADSTPQSKTKLRKYERIALRIAPSQPIQATFLCLEQMRLKYQSRRCLPYYNVEGVNSKNIDPKKHETKRYDTFPCMFMLATILVV
jgi:hypothetical protein